MPRNDYLNIRISNTQIQVTDPDSLPFVINYSLESSEDFSVKTSSQAFDVKIPATLINSTASNTSYNPSIVDLTDGEVFKNFQPVFVESNGYELLTGKAQLKSATHTDKPIDYTYNFFGDNADWLIDMKDKTLWDFLQHITFTFDKTTIQNSWAFDGTNELLPYVFFPVRYRFPMNGYKTDESNLQSDINNTVPDDDNMSVDYLRPALSKYWILYWGLKSVGYRLRSDFTDLSYFRRQCMPWTFGNFLDASNTKLDIHKFLAKSTEDQYFSAGRGSNGEINDMVDLQVSNDSITGGFDNNNDYTYDSTLKQGTWKYNAPDFGLLTAGLSMILYYDVKISGSNSDFLLSVHWYYNGSEVQLDQIATGEARFSDFISGGKRANGQTEVFFKHDVGLNDTISFQVKLRLYRDKHAVNDVAHARLNVLEFKLDYFRIPLGGTINFANYTGFKNYKWVDFLAGIIDEFDLSINTDSINKIVYAEPTHAYSITNNLTDNTNQGYFKDDFLDWNGKQDLSKENEIQLFSDEEKVMTIGYKDDTNDGILKLIQDRNVNKLAAAKYVFPERFQAGSKTRENRFFSPTMHYNVGQWKDLGTGANTGITPQMICIIPENVSNTSESSSENTFSPKSVYYKGLVTGAGAWRFDGEVLQTYPYAFAVNYQAGGEADPILSYSDENINGVKGIGLLKRFYWQRLSIMRNGQYYNAWFRLKNIDVANQIHREYKSLNGQRWELIQVKGYKPLVEDSTQCLLYKWSPVSQKDYDATFPGNDAVLNNLLPPVGSSDIKYARLICLTSDIPK